MRQRIGRFRTFFGASTALGVICVAAACSGPSLSPEPVGSAGQAATGSCATPLIVGQSLFVAPVVSNYNKQQVLLSNTPNPFGVAALADFSFKAVMEKITKTGGAGGTEAAALALYQQLVGTLNAPTCTGTINGFPVDCPSEGRLSGTNPFTGTGGDDIMTPIALVNRFDLAPSNGANCGEYRVVFAIDPAHITLASRFLMIFEATLPNPDPSAHLAGCLPVAEFWDSLSAPAITTSQFASKLKSFYFDGLPGFAPVIQASNYGFGFPTNTNTGQIRLNMLSDTTLDWELRQFELSQDCPDGGACTLTATNSFVGNNPFAGLFATADDGSAFQTQFAADQVKSLAAATIPLIAMSTPNVDNGGESDESGQFQNNNYLTGASGNTKLTNAIQATLTELKSSLTPDDILNRATTQSCAGCHELSPGTSLGGGLTWPNSNGFVQVEEVTGQQSAALALSFLPFRAGVLTRFINKHCADAGAADDQGDGTVTVGGGLVGSAN